MDGSLIRRVIKIILQCVVKFGSTWHIFYSYHMYNVFLWLPMLPMLGFIMEVGVLIDRMVTSST